MGGVGTLFAPAPAIPIHLQAGRRPYQIIHRESLAHDAHSEGAGR